jgi:hypothetical protein
MAHEIVHKYHPCQFSCYNTKGRRVKNDACPSKENSCPPTLFPLDFHMSEQVSPFNEAPAFNYTQSPNPDWKFGVGLSTNTILGRQWKADEDMGYKVFDPSKEEPLYIYPMRICVRVL